MVNCQQHTHAAGHTKVHSSCQIHLEKLSLFLQQSSRQPICITARGSLNILSRIKIQATLIQPFNLAREQYLAGKDPKAPRGYPRGSLSAQTGPRTLKVETKRHKRVLTSPTPVPHANAHDANVHVQPLPPHAGKRSIHTQRANSLINMSLKCKMFS